MLKLEQFGVAVCLAALMAGCAGRLTRVEIKTEPDGAIVSTPDGTVIGKTPMELSGEDLSKNSRDNRIMILLDAPGYVPRQLIFDIHGEDVHKVALTKLDMTYFSQRLLKDYSKSVNEMARELLRIQGLLLVQKLDEAERATEAFQKTYPNIAATYALLANVEMLRGQPQKAHAYLLRGESLDPEDPAIQRALGIQVKTATKTSVAKPPAKAKPKSKGKK